MTSPLPLRTTNVKAHTRSRAYSEQYVSTTTLLMEFVLERAMREACDEIEQYGATLNDPTCGLAI